MKKKDEGGNLKPEGKRAEGGGLKPEVRNSGFSFQVSGFTLLELLLAVGLLGVVTVVTYLCFSSVAVAWQRGMDMTDKLHHADFVVEQLVMGLRSAYYPEGFNPEYGFWFHNDGDGPNAVDEASWVKLGSALVGKGALQSGGPHRIAVTVEEMKGGKEALAVRSWSILSQIEDFDADKLEPTFIAAKITGINYRFQDPETVEDEQPAAGEGATVSGASDKIEWLDDWEDENTNRLPHRVELTVTMEPLEDTDDPVEIKRVVEIPLAPLS